MRDYETATFATGCFWGPDALFGVLPGVIRTRVGYTGGDMAQPTYHNLGTHTEAMQVDYDPDHISYSDLLAVFWANHNPTAKAYKRQYINAVWFHDNAQLAAINATKAQVAARHAGAIQTEVAPVGVFFRAEDYHQKWHLRHTEWLMAHLEGRLTGDAFTDSTMTTRLNGIVTGYGGDLTSEIESYDLPAAARKKLLAML